jgi:hypothetical protein
VCVVGAEEQLAAVAPHPMAAVVDQQDVLRLRPAQEVVGLLQDLAHGAFSHDADVPGQEQPHVGVAQRLPQQHRIVARSFEIGQVVAVGRERGVHHQQGVVRRRKQRLNRSFSPPRRAGE